MLNGAFNILLAIRQHVVACSMLHDILNVECNKTFSTNSPKTKPVVNTMSQQMIDDVSYLVLCNTRKKEMMVEEKIEVVHIQEGYEQVTDIRFTFLIGQRSTLQLL